MQNEDKNKWLTLKEQYELSYKQIEKLTGIPATTYQSWVYDVRKPPEYVYRLLQYFLQSKFNSI